MALEAAHVVLGTGVLAALAVREVLIAERSVEAVAVAAVSVLAFGYLAASFRLRAGQSLLRQELFTLTMEEERRRAENAQEDVSGGPYRAARRSVDDRTPPKVNRWRRFALSLVVVLAAFLVANVPMIAHVLMELTHLTHRAGPLH